MTHSQQPLPHPRRASGGRSLPPAGSRIAEAQRKRWAAAKGASEPAAPATKPKRNLSAASRAAIVAALKKRWAEKRAAAQNPKSAVARKSAPRKAVVRKAA